MKNDFVPQRENGPAQRAVINYRPNGSVESARRLVGGTVARPEERVVAAPKIARKRASSHKPQHTTKLVHPAYRSHEFDEISLRITAIEAEGSTGAPVQVATQKAATPAVAKKTTPLKTKKKKPAKTVDKTAALTKIASTIKPKRALVLPRYMFAAFAAALVLAGTGYVSVDTWVTNKQVKEVATQRAGEPGVAGASSRALPTEGEDETEVKPSAIDSYTVAADLPRVLTIDSINVRARVLPMSVNPDGAMQAPINIFDSGWYGGSAKPGTPGAAVIDAHASGATREGLFAYLDKLSKGDRMSVERGDGTKINYEVTHTETVALDAVDMPKLLRTHNGVAEGLNLITCTGKWLADKKTYDKRVIVYTKRV